MENIYLRLLDIQKTDTHLVLATVTKAVGSTPQKPGSSALFNSKGLICGTVGGGYIEREVQKITQSVLRTGQSGYYHFGLNHSINDPGGAICGGMVTVLMDAFPSDHHPVFEMIKNSLFNRTPGVLVSRVCSEINGNTRLRRYWFTANGHKNIPDFNESDLEPEIDRLLLSGDPHAYNIIEINKPVDEVCDLFLLEKIFPPARLVIAGAGHIGKALSSIGKQLDFEVTVIDSRPEYANAANLPDADQIITDDIGTVVGKLEKTRDTYVVIVTHGHRDDAKALKACIGSDVAYIGMIGSKHKIAQMRNEFILQGWSSTEAWEKIHAPIGLMIQPESVQEIAISIAAELIHVKNSKKHSYV